jgi:alkyl hydroperoxide reductase subunit D
MTLEQLREEIPDYAKDLRLNLTSALRQTELTERQLWGTAVACSLAGHNARLYSAVLHDAAEHLDETALNAAKSAAAIMGMNNYLLPLHPPRLEPRLRGHARRAAHECHPHPRRLPSGF